MGDKKRKLEDEVDAVAPDGKKLKAEQLDRKEKKERKKEAKREKASKKEKVLKNPSEQIAEESAEALAKKERKEKKHNKRARSESQSEPVAATEDEENADNGEVTKKSKKEKKEKKDKKEKQAKKEKKEEKSDEPEADKQQTDAPAEEPTEEAKEEAKEAAEESVAGKNSRFICFVGNLPYSANQESLAKHFEKNPPAVIRVATKKDDPKNRCRGFAFIEFDNYDRMKTCLKLYHHSNFDDGKYPPRRINVELTAGGGGGKSDHRRAKIQAKNEKLNDERQRAAKDIKKEKNKHARKEKPQGASGANAVEVDSGNANGDAAYDEKYANVHPSRRPRMW